MDKILVTPEDRRPLIRDDKLEIMKPQEVGFPTITRVNIFAERVDVRTGRVFSTVT